MSNLRFKASRRLARSLNSARTDSEQILASSGCIEASDTVSDLEIKTWHDIPAQEIEQREFLQDEPNHSSPPFDISSAVNRKLAIYQGDFTKLMVDALVNPTNEHLNDKNSFSRTLIERAGPQLRKDLHSEIKSECVYVCSLNELNELVITLEAVEQVLGQRTFQLPTNQ